MVAKILEKMLNMSKLLRKFCLSLSSSCHKLINDCLINRRKLIMKKCYLILFVFLFFYKVTLLPIPSCNTCTSCSCETVFECDPWCDEGNHFTSQTFMMTRPVSQNVAAYQSLWHTFIHNKKGDFKGSFQLTAYYQQSIPLRETSEYFLFDFKDQLLVLVDGTCLFVLSRLK